MPEGDVFTEHDKPLVLSRDQLLDLLEDLQDWVKQDDSMEGSLRYEYGEKPGTYNVAGVMRFGNSMGQGSIRLLQNLNDL